ncbi:MAG: calcium sensor EFh [Planctomycetota bacterium]|nr:MAG: calcium sensor EFh [Planctomycetota bacterium]
MIAMLWLGGPFCDVLQGQGTLRQSLERLDTNGDGKIQPDEITPLARPYLEQISTAFRLRLDRENAIDTWVSCARVYHAMRNGVGSQDVVPAPANGIRSFEPDPAQPLIPEFGLPTVRYPYTAADLEEADRTLRRYDRNDDGYIDRPEALRAKWTHIDPFDTDMNGDDRLSRLELAQRYARRRMLADEASQLRQQAERLRALRQTDEENRRRGESSSEWWRRGGSSYYLTASLLGRFDKNRNGSLERDEAAEMGIPTARIDVDHDGVLSRDELHGYVEELQQQAGDLTQGLPGWFYERDVDGDGQIAMAEYATEWDDLLLAEFTALDANQDGLITATEVFRSKAAVGGTYSNRRAVVLPPRSTVVSEIQIDEDIPIRELQVQLSITHSNTADLDGYLIGPDGTRIELFTAVGGSGNHFDGTVFDDRAEVPITKAQPPFQGRFIPEGLVKRGPGLSTFQGRNARGVWQLVIRGTRSDRFGMLHSWGLILRPEDALMSEILRDAAPRDVDLDQLSKPDERTAPAEASSRSGPMPSRSSTSASRLGDSLEAEKSSRKELKAFAAQLTPEQWGVVKQKYDPQRDGDFRSWFESNRQTLAEELQTSEAIPMGVEKMGKKLLKPEGKR